MRWLADENLFRRNPAIDVVRAPDVCLTESGRMSGVFEMGHTVQLRAAVDDILLLTECSTEGEWEGQVRYLPLR